MALCTTQQTFQMFSDQAVNTFWAHEKKQSQLEAIRSLFNQSNQIKNSISHGQALRPTSDNTPRRSPHTNMKLYQDKRAVGISFGSIAFIHTKPVTSVEKWVQKRKEKNATPGLEHQT